MDACEESVLISSEQRKGHARRVRRRVESGVDGDATRLAASEARQDLQPIVSKLLLYIYDVAPARAWPSVSGRARWPRITLGGCAARPVDGEGATAPSSRSGRGRSERAGGAPDERPGDRGIGLGRRARIRRAPGARCTRACVRRNKRNKRSGPEEDPKL